VYEKINLHCKKIYTTKACIIAIRCLLVLASCKPLEMFRHTGSGTDTYCVYTISKVDNTGAMQALKKGDIICIYCANPFQCVLHSARWIKVYDVECTPGPNRLFIKKDTGISYYVDQGDPSATCTTCPGPNKFELLPN